MLLSAAAAVAAVAALAGPVSPAQAAPDTAPMRAPAGFPVKIFEDNFAAETALNSSKWVTYLGADGARWDDRGLLPPPYSGPNTPHNDLALFSPSQVSVGNGGARLTAQPNTGPYAATYPWVSGIISTEGKFTLPPDRPWYVQVKAWMPGMSQGMWPAIWFLPASGSAFNELDGYEGGWSSAGNGARAPDDTIHCDYFTDTGQWYTEVDTGVSLSSGMHVYGIEWVPRKSVTIFLDGKQVWKTTGDFIPQPYQIMLSLQVAAAYIWSWHTPVTSSTTAATAVIAEVQAFTTRELPPG
jgi:hypothetical protein